MFGSTYLTIWWGTFQWKTGSCLGFSVFARREPGWYEISVYMLESWQKRYNLAVATV